MAETNYTAPAAWNASARYTVSGAARDLSIGNPSQSKPLLYTLTSSDTLPTVHGSPIPPWGHQALSQVPVGTRVWLRAIKGTIPGASVMDDA